MLEQSKLWGGTPGWRRRSGGRGDHRAHCVRWLALGLEFALAADILRTAVAPIWHDIGQLAAIAVLRTGLNYGLEREIARASGTDHRSLWSVSSEERRDFTYAARASSD